MSSELWLRNPSNYVREMIEVGEKNIIFDYGWIVKRRINPLEWADVYFGQDKSYRMIVAGDQGAAEYRPGSNEPVAVYPVWQYGDDESDLETLMANPVGENKDACGVEGVPLESDHVFGQEHRVVVMNFPDLKTGPGRVFVKFLKDLQEEYPDCILHIHGLTIFATACRLDLRAFDWDARFAAAHGTVFLPTGKELRKNESLVPWSKWITYMGFKPVDLADPRNRCMFNMKSARWAADHFTEDSRLILRGQPPPDFQGSDRNYRQPVNRQIMLRNSVHPQPGDKFVCNECSLAMHCKLYREGSVCTVPGSEPKELAAFFQTRDSGLIMDGLAEVVQINSRRLERGLELEEVNGDLDKNVTVLATQLFDQGQKLAKLIDPSLRNPKVQVNLGTTNNNMIVGDPREFVAKAFDALEKQGIARENITQEMIENVLRGVTPGSPAPSPVSSPRIIEAVPVPAQQVVDMSDLPF